MAIALSLAAVGLLFWALLYARVASLPLTALATVIVGYVFGHTFWNLHLGPLPVTFDRLLLGGLALLFAWRLRANRLDASPWSGTDWAIVATLVWLTFSALASRPGEHVQMETSPMWRLLFSFWAPAALFLFGRQSSLDRKTAFWFLGGLALLGFYLAVTALAETAGVWAVVFPKYIANPELGMHFGRARGPALNSVSLGNYLGICLAAVWLILPMVPKQLRSITFALLPLLAMGVLLTYTRSTWIGLIAGGMALLAMQLPKNYRWKVVGGLTLAGVLMATVGMEALMQLKREDSGNVSQHSVQQRKAFAYVSWQMMQDHPLWGVGFGRFYDQKLPYLQDRTQAFELESLRGLHHHNTFLSLLTETGVIGLAAYCGILIGILRCGWQLSQRIDAPDHERRLGMLAVATVMVYLPSALFHDLTLLYTDQWLVFVIAGVAVGCERRRVAISAPQTIELQAPTHGLAPA